MYDANDYVVSTPAVANGVVYVDSANINLYALNARTGDMLWYIGVYGTSSPAVVNGVVYIGGGDGNVYAFGLK